MKAVFGLNKLGTHRATYNNKQIILIKAQVSENGEIRKEVTLDKFTLPLILNDVRFIRQVQNIFVFRDLLGISKSYQKSIFVRWMEDGDVYRPYPVSYYEPKLLPYSKKCNIPGTIMKRWFSDTDQYKVTKRLLGINSIDELPTLMHTLRIKLEAVIERVDRANIFYLTFILDRINHRLMMSLQPTR
jgi:hypothetical protein